ncbi:MAG TPA: hypothetical protein VLL52_08220 [Anaerolineae bacterium]|nr:hypothetical protein [Anaerolineae bacterium]
MPRRYVRAELGRGMEEGGAGGRGEVVREVILGGTRHHAREG